MQHSSRQELTMRVPADRSAGFRRWFRPVAMAVVAIACSVLPSGTSLLLHAAGMAAQELDTDGDTMPDAWEDFFGLNPNDAGDAAGDPDNDGRTNAQEFAAGRHPLGHHVRYFAEGSTGYFDTSVAVLNLSTTDTAHVALALLSESGGVVSHRFTLAPRQRQSVSINTVLGAAGAVAIVVESDVAVAADRFMTWGPSGIGASLDSGALGACDHVVLRGRRDGPVLPLLPAAESRDDAGHRHAALPGRRRNTGLADAHAAAAEPHHDPRQRGRPGARPRVAGSDRHVGRADLRRTRDVPRRRRHPRRRRGVGGIGAALDAVVLR